MAMCQRSSLWLLFATSSIAFAWRFTGVDQPQVPNLSLLLLSDGDEVRVCMQQCAGIANCHFVSVTRSSNTRLCSLWSSIGETNSNFDHTARFFEYVADPGDVCKDCETTDSATVTVSKTTSRPSPTGDPSTMQDKSTFEQESSSTVAQRTAVNDIPEVKSTATTKVEPTTSLSTASQTETPRRNITEIQAVESSAVVSITSTTLAPTSTIPLGFGEWTAFLPPCPIWCGVCAMATRTRVCHGPATACIGAGSESVVCGNRVCPQKAGCFACDSLCDYVMARPFDYCSMKGMTNRAQTIYFNATSTFNDTYCPK